jgi:DNA-binding transcriptional MerR regulator
MDRTELELDSPQRLASAAQAEPVAPKAGSRALARTEPKADALRGAAAGLESRTEVKVPAGLVTPVAGLPAIPAKRYFTIGEVSELCGVKPYVLRYWEQEFTQLRPMKRRGNRRYYQHHEVLLIRRIRELLYEQGFTISGARNQLTDHVAPQVDADEAIERVEAVSAASAALGADRQWQALDLSGLARARPDQLAGLREALLSIRDLLA